MVRSFLPAIAGYIRRPRVNALLESSLQYSLVFVAAGPGYGKTLSVSYYMQTAEVRLLWLPVSTYWGGAADFWEGFVSAAARELPDYARKLKELGFPASRSHFDQFRKITEATASGGKRLVFVVDNYERIRSDETIEFLAHLAECALPNFSLFILCGVLLPFAEVLPATGLFRVTDKHLAFDFAETKEMFLYYGREAPDETVEEALKVTGGWPLGLRLVCETNAGRPDSFSNRTPLQLAADLHEQQYFRKYPQSIQEHLIRFSLLPQFSLDLIRDWDQEDCAELHNLLMWHPFVAYDYETGLFTFQVMYQEFLRHKQMLVSIEARRQIYADAGKWFLKRGLLNEAMDCFWEIPDYVGFLEALTRMLKVRRPAELTDRVLQRLERIPRKFADDNPLVGYCIALMYLNAAEFQRAGELLLEVKSRVEAEPESEQMRLLLGDIYAALADVGICRSDGTSLMWMKKANELIPHGSRIHSRELYAVGNNSVFFLPGGQAGELERMVDYFLEYATYADPVKNGCGHGFEYLFAGEAAYYRGQMDQARIMFNGAILKASQTAQHDIICNALLSLAQIELYYGSHRGALTLLDEIFAHIEKSGAVGLHELRDSAKALIYMRLDDLKMAPLWFGEAVTSRSQPPLLLERKQMISAYYLYLTGQTAKACALMLQLETRPPWEGRWCESFCLHILRALHHMAESAWHKFYPAFQKAYDMAYPNNMKIPLTVYGKDMMAMIDYLRKMDTEPFDMDWLDSVYRESLSFAKRLQMMRRAYRGEAYGQPEGSLTLTVREDETLRYLAQGLTQPEIAKLMGISVNAVKKHVTKIYNKLGAVNRADAIHIASINGLVDVINH